MAISSVYIQFKQDPEADNLLRHLKELGYKLKGLRIERVIRLEGNCDIEKLRPLFVNPLYQTCSYDSKLSPSDGHN